MHVVVVVEVVPAVVIVVETIVAEAVALVVVALLVIVVVIVVEAAVVVAYWRANKQILALSCTHGRARSCTSTIAYDLPMHNRNVSVHGYMLVQRPANEQVDLCICYGSGAVRKDFAAPWHAQFEAVDPYVGNACDH